MKGQVVCFMADGTVSTHGQSALLEPPAVVEVSPWVHEPPLLVCDAIATYTLRVAPLICLTVGPDRGTHTICMYGCFGLKNILPKRSLCCVHSSTVTIMALFMS